MPILASDRTASRIVDRPTPSISDSSGSMGIREPTFHSPVVIWRRRYANVLRARSVPLAVDILPLYGDAMTPRQNVCSTRGRVLLAEPHREFVSPVDRRGEAQRLELAPLHE